MGPLLFSFGIFIFQGIDDKQLVERSVSGETADEKAALLTLRLGSLLNLVLCFQQSLQWAESIRACDAVLELDPHNVKGYYRRALVCSHFLSIIY